MIKKPRAKHVVLRLLSSKRLWKNYSYSKAFKY